MAEHRYSVKEYGAKGDGSTDDTTALSNALSAWMSASGPAVLEFQPGEYPLASAITLTPAANITKRKRIIAHGAKIISTSSSHAIKFNVAGSTKLWRALVVEGITIDGGVDGIVIDGGVPGSTEYFYDFVFRDCKVENFSGTGWSFNQNTFEGSLHECVAWANSNNTTGYGFYLTNGAGAGNISSFDFHNLNTRYGKYGLYALTPVSDVDITGGTFLLAQKEAILIQFSFGSVIQGVHVENNHQDGVDSIRAALYVTGKNFSIINTHGNTDNAATHQAYAVRVYASGGVVNLIGGSADANHTKFAYLQSDTSSTGGSIMAMGIPSYTKLAGSRATVIDANGSQLQGVTLTENFYAYASTVTPDLDIGTWVNVSALTGDITIANPTKGINTFNNGEQLEILLRQDGTGGRAVTWGSNFKVATAIGSSANQRTQWAFRYDGTYWREISASVTAA